MQNLTLRVQLQPQKNTKVSPLDGPFQKKLLPKRALSECDIYLTERAPTEDVDVKTAESRRPILKTAKFKAAYVGNVFRFCWISGETGARNT